MFLRIEEVSKHHDRKAFDCGVNALNQFLQLQARQKAEKNVAKTYVARWDSLPTKILGYYTLTGYSVIVPPDYKQYRNYPHPLNAVKLARLAVSRDHQGQHLGEKLLIDAIYRTVLVSEQISSIGIFVDPTTPDVVPFYKQYGFLLADNENPECLEMWLPIATCIEVINKIS
ncbi:TPA: GNAT family N-acetyltransferase [Salmonella enterica]|uniref:GNAT family N-acetyltransferase n=1 Tax=Salmonella enterica TaxID=28901 RepID=A0A757VVB0_SALER|nr:GNAT family N-acetyltransferase [Salmonella enterica]EBX7469518.1 N-acetyltransferase [Salmonella enterica subsp. enterica serovar Bareilly]EDW2060609.1 GNAT family N-acetyltransferase [Salmonella enterica subsp. enterica serovar Oslo]EDY1997994.1 GNAT family N-acetyltransferase [Salmonella enterica subsp. diarizonae]EHD9482413.1 GNAT family N-acetyltransferase [Salmonella enterica subsp. enterica serovar Typhimurium]EAS3780357.1 GNAT family N-acetyltransferase [Salmonella enterica]